jgi:hypothetical protein
MPGFIWNANPKMWQATSPTTDGWQALWSYMTDESQYVYWSTPKLRTEIRAGARAVLWRTTNKKGPNGIIAIGRVEESPRPLTPATKPLFSFPTRTEAAGWAETAAPSIWKTGIRLESVFWNDPINTGMRPPQGTVGRISDDNLAAIDRAAMERSAT